MQMLITAAVEYLKNATGKEYPEKDEKGNTITYELEKVYLKLLIAYWYENRTPVGKVGEEFSQMTKSLSCNYKISRWHYGYRTNK